MLLTVSYALNSAVHNAYCHLTIVATDILWIRLNFRIYISLCKDMKPNWNIWDHPSPPCVTRGAGLPLYPFEEGIKWTLTWNGEECGAVVSSRLQRLEHNLFSPLAGKVSPLKEPVMAFHQLVNTPQSVWGQTSLCPLFEAHTIWLKLPLKLQKWKIMATNDTILCRSKQRREAEMQWAETVRE